MMIRTMTATAGGTPRAAGSAALLIAVQLASPDVNAQANRSFLTETASYGLNNMPPFTDPLADEQIRTVSVNIINDLFKQAAS